MCDGNERLTTAIIRPLRSLQRLLLFLGLVGIVAALPGAGRSQQAKPVEKLPIILDTDIGSYIDDAFALALVLASPELELRGVTTVGADTMTRAWMVCRFLTMLERKNIPVAAGADPQPKREIAGMYQYRNHPAVIFNRTSKPVKESAVEFTYRQLQADPGKITLVTIGPLTNIARLITDHPDCKPWIKRIVIMGGSLKVGYDNKPPAVAEINFKTDPKAAQTVFSSGVPLVVAPLDATLMNKLEGPLRDRFFAAGSMLTYQVQALYQMGDDRTPTLFDPAAVALAMYQKPEHVEPFHLEVDDQGQFTRVGKEKPNAAVFLPPKEGYDFVKWYVNRVAGAFPAAPGKAPGNRSQLVRQGGFPNRVHAFEDYETDIERRWWMSGRAETANVPSAGGRSCRGILTLDFDDLMGDLKTLYNAVIFNPVPGPPMGKNTRLSFRYWLKGTDTIRVQLYSLSNGYHRYLSVTGLAQEQWLPATVDMTAMRRPDGSAPPLSENERIDDIQFYVDPKAELLIDDIVLYDAAMEGEKRPFPKRILFTGWFDSGKQGKEWPGTFDILPKKGYFWNAARSVDNPQAGRPWIRLHLRGERSLAEATQLAFRYHLTGADAMEVTLRNEKTGEGKKVELKGLTKDKWTETTVDFTPIKLLKADEILFVLPKGAELLVDDLLLFEPGQ